MSELVLRPPHGAVLVCFHLCERQGCSDVLRNEWANAEKLFMFEDSEMTSRHANEVARVSPSTPFTLWFHDAFASVTNGANDGSWRSRFTARSESISLTRFAVAFRMLLNVLRVRTYQVFVFPDIYKRLNPSDELRKTRLVHQKYEHKKKGSLSNIPMQGLHRFALRTDANPRAHQSGAERHGRTLLPSRRVHFPDRCSTLTAR
jgi:hypothetical protein